MSLTISQLDADDVTEACTLFREVFSSPVDPHAWRWKYSGEAQLDAINLVAHDEAGRLIGHAGAVVLPGMDRGLARVMVQVCDVMVAAQQRGRTGDQAVYPALMRALRTAILQRFPQAYVYGFPGKRPFLLGQRLGFYHRISNIQEFALTAQIKTQMMPWGYLRNVRVVAWDELQRLEANLRRLEQEVTSLDQEPRVVRDMRYLHWRYACHPTRKYILLVWQRLWSMHAAWVVCAEGEGLRVVDTLGLAAQTASATKHLADWAARQGYQYLLTWYPPDLEPLQARETGIVAMQFALKASDGKATLRHPRFSPSDLDIF